jgi:hypothetical protein
MLRVGTVLLAVGLAAGVRIGGGTNFIPSTYQYRVLSLTLDTLFEGSTLVSLTAGNVLDLAVQALVALSVSLGIGMNAYLTVKKISG